MHDSDVVARVWSRRMQRSMACLEALDIHVHMLTVGEWQEGPAMHTFMRCTCAQLPLWNPLVASPCVWGAHAAPP